MSTEAETAEKALEPTHLDGARAEARKKRRRRLLRLLLLGVIPLVALGIGAEFYLRGGRYIATDNAYVGAQKVLVTPQVSGTIDAISVVEGQSLKAGDPLFSIDRKPYEIALAQSEAALAKAGNDFHTLASRLQALKVQIALASDTVALRQGEFDRKSNLLRNKVASVTDVEENRIAAQQAKAALELLQQQQAETLAQLGGKEDAALAGFAPYAAAKAAVEQAQWNLDHTVIKAPLAGIATQVSNIQMGRYLTAGSTVFAIVSDDGLWVDANPKETDITWLVKGQPATVTVDAFPDHPIKAHVEAISPGTGAQFSLIPAQNASGNWVKVVQRVPVRLVMDETLAQGMLRAGMSVSVKIDTGRERSLMKLLGLTAAAGEKQAAK
ncbi:MAG: HlyD family secretion protein [Hyphomicrobiales bacterium]